MKEEILNFEKTLLKEKQSSDFVLGFCRKNKKHLKLMINDVFFKNNLHEELEFLLKSELINDINNPKILEQLYLQDFEIIIKLHEYKLFDINDSDNFKELLLNRGINNQNEEFISFLLNNIDTFKEIRYDFFITPIFQNNKKLLKILITSDKIPFNEKFLTLLYTTFSMDVNSTNTKDLLCWFLNFEKISNLCSKKWVDSLQDTEAKKFFHYILSLKNF